MSAVPGPSKAKESCSRQRAVPGTSKAKESCSRQPRKKQKLDENKKLVAKSSSTIAEKSSSSIDILPDEMLIEIFTYFTFEERLQLKKVCSRWHKVVQSEVFWRFVEVTNINASLLVEIISFLPSCVSYLQCHTEQYTSILLTLPQIIVKLNDKCPNLKAVILENINFVNNCPTGVLQFNFDQIIDENVPVCPVFQVNEGDYNEQEEVELMDAVLPELQVLSLRSIQCSPLHLYTHISTSVLPKLVVLDLSFSVPTSVIEHPDGLFSSLIHLEELYLVGWNTRDYSIETFLKRVRKLRVLDLESSIVTKNTILTLKRNSAWLEKLYLACVHDLGDIRRTADDEMFFPRLKFLCLKHTNVSVRGIEELLEACPSIDSINVNYCEGIQGVWYHDLPNDIREKVYLEAAGDFICNHFLKSKHCTKEEYAVII